MQRTSRAMSVSVCLDSGFRKRAEGIRYLSSSNGHLKNNWNAEGVPLRAEGALLCGISLSIRDEICDSGLDAPIGAMRPSGAQKSKYIGRMQAQRHTRSRVSTIYVGTAPGQY